MTSGTLGVIAVWSLTAGFRKSVNPGVKNRDFGMRAASLLPYGTTSEQIARPPPATSLWRSVADAASYGPDEDGLASRPRPARGRELQP